MAIVNAWGVVLSRRDHGEADRLCTLYTENLGKIPVRFVGVNKPGRKLKALSEPLVWAEYRLYVSPRNDYGKAIGGQLISSFPSIRTNFARTVAALGCCELLECMTAGRVPNPEEYQLICATLAELEAGGSAWAPLSFGLRLLGLAGLGVEREATVEEPSLWTRLHAGDLSGLAFDAAANSRMTELVRHHVEGHTGRMLKSREFARSLALC